MPHPEHEHALQIALATALRERDEAKDETNARIAAVIHTIGGAVEGYPTSALNYLQRLRALVAIEKAFVDAGPMVASAKYMVEKARDCERAEEALAAARRECEGLRKALTQIVLDCDCCSHECERCGASDPITSFDLCSVARAALAAPAAGEEGP